MLQFSTELYSSTDMFYLKQVFNPNDVSINVVCILILWEYIVVELEQFFIAAI